MPIHIEENEKYRVSLAKGADGAINVLVVEIAKQDIVKSIRLTGSGGKFGVIESEGIRAYINRRERTEREDGAVRNIAKDLLNKEVE